jgi:hypothetical protein
MTLLIFSPLQSKTSRWQEYVAVATNLIVYRKQREKGRRGQGKDIAQEHYLQKPTSSTQLHLLELPEHLSNATNGGPNFQHESEGNFS